MKQYFFILLFLILFGSLGLATETILFNDNFNSGSLAGYDQNSGTWSAASFYLDGSGLDGGGISHTVSGLNAGRTYRFYYKDKPVAGANGEFVFFTDQNGILGGNVNGYNLVLSSGTGLLRRITNGTYSTILNVGSISSGSYHDVNITATYDGNIQVWIDGVSKGSVLDTTYNHGSRITFGTDNGATNHNFEDVNVLFTGDTNTTFKFVDETNLSTIQPALTINGNAWPVRSDGTFDNNSDIVFPATFVATLANYRTRTYVFDSNAGLNANAKLGMRSSTEAQTIDFTFYAPDQTTVLSNQYIRVLKNGANAGQLKTNANGQASFSLAPQDNGYSFKIYSGGSDQSVQYTYTSATVTVNQPIDESTLVPITPNLFNLAVGGLGLQSYTNQVLPISTIFILGNTDDAYTLRVDSNVSGVYFPRNYLMQLVGNTSTLTIQPYLITAANGVPTNVTVKDNSIGNPTIPGIRLKVQTGIGGVITTVEDELTNFAGTGQFTLIHHKDYTITASNVNQSTIYFPINGISNTFSDTSDTFFLFVNFSTNDLNFSINNKDINYAPNADFLTGTTQKVDVNVDANFSFNRILIEALDGNFAEASTICMTNPCRTSFNLTLKNFDTNYAIIHVSIQRSDQNIDSYRTYFVLARSPDLIDQARGLRNQIGPIGLLFILFIVWMITWGLLGESPIGNNDSRVIIFVIETGVFVLLWWYDSIPIILTFVGAIFGTAAIYLYQKNRNG